ncbi:MAG: hypothetical protein Q7S29_05410 [Candidatus Peribacter sp.]|nr:hypothetical protein [Candidatus Peribacter sp.]
MKVVLPPPHLFMETGNKFVDKMNPFAVLSVVLLLGMGTYALWPRQSTPIPTEVPAKNSSIKELQFNIDGEYLGQGEIKTSVQTNLWPGTEVDLSVYSVSKINPDDTEPPEDDGTDYSRSYSLYSIAMKNQPIAEYVPGGNGLVLGNFSRSLIIQNNGEARDYFLLFQSEALQHSLEDISNLNDQVNEGTLNAGNLVNQLKNRQAFEHDQKVILKYEINKWRSNGEKQEDNFAGIDIGTIQLPENCKLLTGQKYGQTWHTIQCTKEMPIPTISGENGDEEQAAEEANQIKKDTEQAASIQAGLEEWQEEIDATRAANEKEAEANEEAARPFVQICAENQIREMLRSPSTAKFSWTPDISKYGNNYAVFSYVDAQNAFGATLRQNWQCRVILGQGANALNDCVATCTFSGQ